MTSIETLYKCCEKLDAAGGDIAKVSLCTDISYSSNVILLQHQNVYDQIIRGVTGDLACKKLAAQLIVRFFHKFDAKDNALDALFELCESDDIVVRRWCVLSPCTLPSRSVAQNCCA